PGRGKTGRGNLPESPLRRFGGFGRADLTPERAGGSRRGNRFVGLGGGGFLGRRGRALLAAGRLFARFRGGVPGGFFDIVGDGRPRGASGRRRVRRGGGRRRGRPRAEGRRERRHVAQDPRLPARHAGRRVE